MRARWIPALRALVVRPLHTETVPGAAKRSIFVRHLDGGSSNVVESELVALTSPIYDLSQYGIRFVASPSHADVLLLTGPLTLNMLGPAREAFRVMPAPKSIVTVGDYAGAGDGPGHADGIVDQIARLLDGSYATVELPADMRAAVVAHVPGDPPHPAEIIRALLSVPTAGRSR